MYVYIYMCVCIYTYIYILDRKMIQWISIPYNFPWYSQIVIPLAFERNAISPPKPCCSWLCGATLRPSFRRPSRSPVPWWRKWATDISEYCSILIYDIWYIYICDINLYVYIDQVIVIDDRNSSTNECRESENWKILVIFGVPGAVVSFFWWKQRHQGELIHRCPFSLWNRSAWNPKLRREGHVWSFKCHSMIIACCEALRRA